MLDDDTKALGDWTENTTKLPHGVAGLAERINDLGMDFGIWVEPEMVNVDSDLYRKHPDWAICIPDKNHTEGRNQRILDFANPEVVEYMTNAMTKVFSLGNIAYVKWDMNRTFTDYYSQYLPKERQGEVGHRYITGVYKMMKTLTEKRFFEWHEDSVSVTLRNKGGSYGGGSEVLVIECDRSRPLQPCDNRQCDNESVLSESRSSSHTLRGNSTDK